MNYKKTMTEINQDLISVIEFVRKKLVIAVDALREIPCLCDDRNDGTDDEYKCIACDALERLEKE